MKKARKYPLFWIPYKIYLRLNSTQTNFVKKATNKNDVYLHFKKQNKFKVKNKIE